jgi:hypothetical protein
MERVAWSCDSSCGTKFGAGLEPLPDFWLYKENPMGVVGGLWNQDVRSRLQCIHRHIARQAASSEPSAKRPPPQFQRRRPGTICDAILAVLVEHRDGLRMRDITAAVAERLGEPVSTSSVKSCLWREAQGNIGKFERIGRGRYRLRSAAT